MYCYKFVVLRMMGLPVLPSAMEKELKNMKYRQQRSKERKTEGAKKKKGLNKAAARSDSSQRSHHGKLMKAGFHGGGEAVNMDYEGESKNHSDATAESKMSTEELRAELLKMNEGTKKGLKALKKKELVPLLVAARVNTADGEHLDAVAEKEKDWKDKRATKNGKVLLVCDINGTLLHRKWNDKAKKGRGEYGKALARPYVGEFFNHFKKSRNVDLALWTGANTPSKEETIVAALEAACPGIKKACKKRIMRASRAFKRTDKGKYFAGTEKIIVVKPVSMLKAWWPEYNGIVLLDNDIEKSQGMPKKGKQVLKNHESEYITVKTFDGDMDDTELCPGGAPAKKTQTTKKTKKTKKTKQMQQKEQVKAGGAFSAIQERITSILVDSS